MLSSASSNKTGEKERDREMRETQGRRDALLLIKQRRKMKGGKKKEKEKRKRKVKKKGKKEGRKEGKGEGTAGGPWPAVADDGRRWPEKTVKALKTQTRVVQV